MGSLLRGFRGLDLKSPYGALKNIPEHCDVRDLESHEAHSSFGQACYLGPCWIHFVIFVMIKPNKD